MRYLMKSISSGTRGGKLAASFGFLLVLAAAATGCGGRQQRGGEAEPGITRTFERGPVHLTLHVSRELITTAETLEVTLTGTADEGYALASPPYPTPEPPKDSAADDAKPEAAAEKPVFTLSGDEEAPPSLGQDGRVTRSRVYRLEPFLAGDYTVPPLPVSYWKEGEGGNPKSVLETEPVPITVASVIDPNVEPGFKDIGGPVILNDPVPWVRYAILLVLLAAALGAAYWYKFVRVPPPTPAASPVPPHQRALEALEAIQRAKLVEQGLYKEYYIRVSDVLRRYMEEQFHLRAPERTTEEFLDEIQHNGVLGLQEQLLLREFLRHCDLVKFAKAEPTSEQIRETYATCEQFIIDSEAACRASRMPAEAAPAGEA